jgi:uridine kinase
VVAAEPSLEALPALRHRSPTIENGGRQAALPAAAGGEVETDEITRVALTIARARARAPAGRAILVAISGIDASGKGYVTERLRVALQARGVAAVTLHADEWLNLPERRFSKEDPGRHFYLHAIRFEEMLERLVLPLTHTRRCHLTADALHETATAFEKRTYDYEDVEVVLLEGIFLLKPSFRALYDLSVWVDCTFETALGRALQRRQEGHSVTDTIRAYETIYFPAQQIHLLRDDPRSAATIVLQNDPLIALVLHR